MDKLKAKTHSLLRRSESLFKTDMVYLAKGGFWLTLLQAISSISSFVLAIGFAHFLSKDTYGTYKYIMSVGGILAAFSLTGLSTVVTNAAARNQDSTLGFAFKKNLSWGALTFAIFAASAGYYFLHNNALLAWGLVIIGAATPLLGSASLSDSFFVGKKDFKRSALTSGLAILLTNSSTLLVAILTKSIIAIVITYTATSLAVELIIYMYAVYVYVPKSKPVDPDAIRYGAHLSMIGIINILVDRLDSVFAFHYLGAAELAVYSFAIAIPEQLKGFAKNASTLALPRFSESEPEKIYRGIVRKMLIMGMGVAAIITAYIIFTPFIFHIFFPQYAGTSVFLSRLYALTLITVINILPVTYLQSISATRELYMFNAASGIIQIIIMGFGTALYGLMGLIIGIGISRLFRLWFSLILMHRGHRALLLKKASS